MKVALLIAVTTLGLVPISTPAIAVEGTGPVDHLIRCAGAMTRIGLYEIPRFNIDMGPGQGIVTEAGREGLFGYFTKEGEPYYTWENGKYVKVYPYLFVGGVTTANYRYCTSPGACEYAPAPGPVPLGPQSEDNENLCAWAYELTQP